MIWAAACAAAILLPFTDIIELKALDGRFGLRGTVEPATPILIVSIDDDSLYTIDTQWSNIRSYLAKAIDTISAGGARAIGLDILLIDPSLTQQEDADLAASMRRSGRVVVVSRFYSMSESEFDLRRLDKPIPVFEGTYQGMGYADFLPERDRFVRRLKLFEVVNDQPHYPIVLPCSLARRTSRSA